MTWAEILESRLVQAFVAGLFVASGWLFNGRQNRLAAARERDEKRRDYHRALYAEIGTTLSNLQSEAAIEADAAPLIARMENDPDFVPLIPREQGDFTFDTLVSQIHILPRQTIDPVVAYYTQIKAIAALADDMRGESFRRIGADRRLAMYRDYLEMKKQALRFGSYACALIVAYSEGGPEGADAKAEVLNSRAGALSDRSQE